MTTYNGSIFQIRSENFNPGIKGSSIFEINKTTSLGECGTVDFVIQNVTDTNKGVILRFFDYRHCAPDAIDEHFHLEIDSGVPLDKYTIIKSTPTEKIIGFSSLQGGYRFTARDGKKPNNADAPWRGADVHVEEIIFKLYLTFDDGPRYGTDDIIRILDAEGIKGTFFFVGTHMDGNWYKDRVIAAKNSGHLIGNHSFHHDYKYITPGPSWMLDDFEKCDKRLCKVLGIDPPTRFIYARLPGRDTWRVGSVNVTDFSYNHDSAATADLLHSNGYVILGWDDEWQRYEVSNPATGAVAGDPSETAEAVARRVRRAILGYEHREIANKLVLLTHDLMFRNSHGKDVMLEDFIRTVKKYGVRFCTVDQY